MHIQVSECGKRINNEKVEKLFSKILKYFPGILDQTQTSF